MSKRAFGVAIAVATAQIAGGCGDGTAAGEQASPLSASKAAVQDRRIASAKLQEVTGLSHMPFPENDAAFDEALRRHYPREFASRGIRGAVLADVTLDARGIVQAVAIVPSAPADANEYRAVIREEIPRTGQVVEREPELTYHPAFGPAAEAALKETRFRPALRDGRPVAHTIRMTIAFPLPRN